MVPVVVGGSITDALSGVNPSTASFAVVDEYGQIQPTGPVTLHAGGTFCRPRVMATTPMAGTTSSTSPPRTTLATPAQPQR